MKSVIYTLKTRIAELKEHLKTAIIKKDIDNIQRQIDEHEHAIEILTTL